LFDDQYNVTLDSPEAIASLQWVVDNLQEYHIYPPDVATYDYTEFHTLFIQGRVAMAINWPYMYSMAQDPEQSKVVGLVAVGRKPGQVTHGGNIGGWSWNVFKMSKNQDLAIAFAKFMSSPDVALAFSELNSMASARSSVMEIMAEKDPVVFGAIAANLPDGRGVKWIDTGPSWTSVEQAQYQAIQEALTGAKTPEQALKDAKQKIEEILEEDEFYTKILPQLLGQQ
jgi:ABC-type glycerol-3-phosphate transport system substrate-binding protein